MSPTDLLVLALLAQAPGHGYDLKKRLERLSSGTFALNDKLLYPALRRFEEEGLLSSERRLDSAAPPRRVFALTAQGHDALRSSLEDFSETAARNPHEFQVRFLLFRLLPAEVRLAIIERRRRALEGSLERIAAGSVIERVGELAQAYAPRLVDLARRQAEAELRWLDEQHGLESASLT